MFLAWCVVGIASKRVVIGDLIKSTVTVISRGYGEAHPQREAVWVGEDGYRPLTLPYTYYSNPWKKY